MPIKPNNEVTIDCYAQEDGALKEVGKYKIAKVSLQYDSPPYREGAKGEKFFLNASAFGGSAAKEILDVKKGDYVRVFGALSIRNYKDQNDQWKQVTDLKTTRMQVLEKATPEQVELNDDYVPF